MWLLGLHVGEELDQYYWLFNFYQEQKAIFHVLLTVEVKYLNKFIFGRLKMYKMIEK